MDVRFVLLFHFLLAGGWTFDATEPEATEVETSDSDAPEPEAAEVETSFIEPEAAEVETSDSDAPEPEAAEVETSDSDAPDLERDKLFYNQLAQRIQSGITQTSASPSSRGGRIGSLRQAGRHGRGRGSTQPVRAIIEEVRPVVPTPTAAVETSTGTNKATATGSQMVGQKRPALEGGHSPNEPAEARPRVESSGASVSQMPVLEDAQQITSAQVCGQLTCILDQMAENVAAINNQLGETRKRLEAAERTTTKAVEEKVAAEHARIAAEEEAATKVKSLQVEHQRALSDLKLKHDRALTEERSRFSGVVGRLQQVEVSLANAQPRQEAVASELEAMNEEASAESQEAELVVVPSNEDVDEVAADGTQPVAEEGFTDWAGGEEGDAI